MNDGDAAGDSITFGELDLRVEGLALALRTAGLRPGDRALLLYPPGLEFIAGFLGCLAAGVIAVPAYPVTGERGLPRLLAMARDCQPRLIVTTKPQLARLAAAQAQVPALATLPILASDDVVCSSSAEGERLRPRPDDIAFLQYTSGSTATPKGVRVSHGNLLHNEEMIRRAFGQSRDSVIVSWLPLYHDMGLIGGVLQPLYLGARCVLMSPLAFLQQPVRWLRAITNYRATTSGGPDFAYSLAARKVSEEDKAHLDLRSWQLAFNGAEPVRASTLERFARAFAGCGFQPDAFYPCYGLAEATLFATGGRPGHGARLTDLDAAALEAGKVSPARGGSPRRTLTSAGRPSAGQVLAIVDPETATPVALGRVGEIWLAGPSVARGYWRRDEETAATFGAHLPGGDRSYLRTGDLGFLKGGELFVTGRLKDLIILRGRNLYPQDLEATAERAHRALRPGCSAAFALEGGEEERVVLVAELDRRAVGPVEAIRDAVAQAVAAEHDVALAEVVLIREQTLPKTSSGKVQRGACRRVYLEGALERVGSVATPAPPDERATPEPTPAEPDLVDRLAAVFAEVLRRPAAELPRDRPITALGVDSLAAAELALRLPALGLAPDLADLLAGPTLAELAGSARAPDTAAESAVAESAGTSWEASPGQAALWFLDRLAPGNPAYVIARAARVRGPLDAPRLAAAFAALLTRHPGLSQRFRGEGERVLVRTGPPPARETWWSEHEAAGLAAGELEAALAALAFAPFDLGSGDLLRLAVFHRGVEESVLLLALHHLAADFRSLETLTRELAVLYQDPAAVLPAPGASLGGATAALARRVGEREAGLLAFWREELEGLPEALDLPTDRPRPVAPSFRGGQVRAQLDGALTGELRSLARRSETTLFAAVAAVCGALLARLAGTGDLALGVPTRLPSREVPAESVGYWVNPVVLRLRPRRGVTLAGLTGEAGSALRRALAHADLPFPRLVAELAGGRDLARSPLFQALIHLEEPRPGSDPALAAFAVEDDGAALRLGELALSPLPLAERGAQFDLTLAAAPVGDGLALAAEYARDLFDATTIERWLGHLTTLLRNALAGPDTPLAALSLLSAGERSAVLAASEGEAPPAAPELLSDLVFAQAERTPEATAVRHLGRSLTYRALAAGARAVAAHLLERGAGPERGVAVALERGLDLPAALLGVLAAGSFYVPLDPTYPEDRLAFLLEDAAPVALIASPAVLNRLPMALPPLLLLDGRELAPPRRMTRLAQPPLPANLAYLIYTSGSTGRPKAVAITHQNAAAMVRWALTAFERAELASVLASTSVCFDLSVFELFAPLAAGGTVVMAANALEVAAFGTEPLCLINTVPSAMAELLRLAAVPRTVVTVNLAGEALPRTLVEEIYALGHVRRVANLYGPSEDTTYSTHSDVQSSPGERVTIGRPIRGGRARVVDAGFGLQPVGVPGELLLGGAGVARGYLGRPAQTAERFVPDAFTLESGARLYRTGDLVRLLASGELEFLGRLDHQVKVRGFRIELGEIEAALLALDGVTEAVVVALRGADGDLLLAAYVAPHSAPAADELARSLATQLPACMVPQLFVPLAALPRTPNGKVDRRALPAPARAARDGSPAFTDPFEAEIGAHFAAALGLPEVDRHANFFTHGGHSLKAASLAAALSQELGAPVPVSLIFEAPTVAALAARLPVRSAAAAEPAAFAAPPAPARVSDRIPLSPAQERMWFLGELAPDQPIYNLSGALSLSGRLDRRALRSALAAVVARHEPLATAIRSTPSGPEGRLLPGLAPACPLVDLGSLRAAERERLLPALLRAEARRSFDLARPPLLRAVAFCTGAFEHVLSLTFHHVASDGASLAVFRRELEVFYRAARRAVPALLPPLALRYRDAALLERERRGQPATEAALAFWRERLAGAPELSTLPGDRPRPAVESHRGATLAFRWPEGLHQLLARRASATGTTVFMAVAAGLIALLDRSTGARDHVLGAPTANRDHPALEGLIGLFVNTLALRVESAGDPPFAELLGRVRRATLAAFEHGSVPLDAVIEAVAPPRSLAASPLFQVVLAFTNAPPMAPDLPGLEVAIVDVDPGTAKFDLTLMMADTGAELAGHLEYATDLYDRTTAERFLGALATLLAGAAAEPERALSSLPVLSAAERAELAAWNDTAVPLPEATVDALARAAGGAAPEAVAVVAGEEQLSYGELLARSSTLAALLAARGVGPEVAVGLCLPRSPELLVATLATLSAGGAYVPLDPTYPDERLALLAEDSGVAIILTAGGEAERLGRLGAAAKVLALDRPLPRATPAPARPALGPERAAYIMYTSGSTGRPKGVVIPHRGIVRLVRPAGAAPVSPPPVTLFISATAFDAATYEIWLALANGGRVVLAPPGPIDLAAIAALYPRYQIRFSFLTAGLFHQLAEDAPSCFAGLRELLAGGDVVSPAHVAQVLASCPDIAITNGYGPTENTTFTATFTARAGRPVPSPFPLGRPIPNTEVWILGRRLEPSPFGQPGELAAGGAGLARGYQGRPGLTAERFVPDAESGAPGARLYRTGDLARWRSDGTLEFLGRLDDQVKIRGFRIEPGEIEAVLAGHPAVEHAIVVVREGSAGKRLVAYARARPGSAVSPAELTAFVAARLPAYMVPAAVVEVAEWPLTPHGKIDRRRLQGPQSGQGEERAFAAPATATEVQVAAVWAELLGLPAVSTADDFFALGGHSLLAMRLVARLSERFAVPLPLATLFAAPTVAELARALDAARGDGVALAPIEPLAPGVAPPLSFAQERLWFLSELDPESATYNVALAIGLAGELSPRALTAALGAIQARHEPLRARFPAAGGRPTVALAEHLPGPLVALDLAGLPEVARAAEAERLAAREARRPFALATGPLLRAVLLRRSQCLHALLLTLHHIATDGWSTGVLLAELEAGYRAALAGREAEFAPLPVTYGAVAAWQREWLTGTALARELAFWREELSGGTPLLLPTDRPRRPVTALAGRLNPLSLPPDLTAGIEALARQAGTTPFAVLAAALAALLSRLTGTPDLCIGTPVAGRSRPELEGLIGLFVNTVVLRFAVASELPFAELLRTTRSRSQAAFAHDAAPFEMVVDALVPDRDLAQTPLFQVMLALTSTPLDRLTLPGLATTIAARDTGTAKFELTFGLAPRGGGLEGGIEAASALFDATTVERWGRAWVALLGEVVRSPERRVGELALLSAAERQALVEWNDTAAEPMGGVEPAGGTVHGLVLAAAGRSPQAIAAHFEDQHLSYGALAAESAHHAAELLAAGLAPEEPVGLAAARSLELPVGLLAILRAGGAYLPLDPSYPAERLAFMRADSGARRELSPRLGRSGAAPAIAVEVDPEQLVSVIYTSGSTGRPKGVGNHHRGLVNRLRFMSRLFPDGGEPRVIQKTPLSFDVSAWEIFWPLTHGGRLLLARPGGQRDAAYLRDLVAERGATTVHFVASLLDAWLALPGLEELPALRRVISSGEAVSRATVERFHGRFSGRFSGGVELWDFYGPTEASIEVTAARCDASKSRAAVAIGRPIAGALIHILARGGRPAARGSAGELAIGGVPVARGYLGRPALTAERFVPDADAGTPGARCYRTGDLARHRADGAIDYLGRLDSQVKIRGFRVELGEIEARLREIPAVADAAVVLASGERLAAYVTAAPGAEPTAAALAAHLALCLPAHMVPQAFAVLPALPLSPAGKLDRRSLPAPSWGEAKPGGDGAPTGPLAELAAGIWCAVLGVAEVGADDDFFARGGHSLLAAQVVARLRSALGREVPLRLLFEHRTLAAFARALAVEGDAAASGPALARLPAGVEAPLSFAQERLWVLDRFEPGNVAFNMPGRLRLAGRLRVAALGRALAALLRRHRVLRTALPSRGGRPAAVVVELGSLPLPLLDLGALAPADAEREAGRLAAHEAARPFDLARAPLLRSALVRRGEEAHDLLLTLHHAAGDGWSLGLLARELGALYRPAGEPPELPPPALDYADYAAWQRAWLESEAAARELAFWRERLAGAPNGLGLPTDRPRKPVRTFRGASVARRLPPGERRAIEELARAADATLYMVLLTAFEVLLARLSGERDILVGTPVATRGRTELEGVVGILLNTLVLRSDTSGDPSFSTLLARVRATTLDAFAHAELPFERLLEALHPERDPSRTPLFEVFFNLLSFPFAPPPLAELGVTLEMPPSATSKFDLTLYADPRGEDLELRLTYNADLFDAARIETMLGQLTGLLQQAAALPKAPIYALSLQGEGPLPNLAAPLPSAPEPTVLELFTARARQAPAAPAIVHRGRTWTYGELAREVSGLARQLSAVGIGPGDAIAIYAHRSPALASAVLGVLAAGAAFVILDPAHPAARLAAMLERLPPAAAVLLTEAGEPPAAVSRALAHLPAKRRLELGALAGPPGEDGGGSAATDDLPAALGPEDLAYYAFTSGSTGEPKGIVGRLGPLSHFLPWYRDTFGIGPGDRVSMLSGLSHDPLHRDLFLSLCLGATLTIPDPGELLKPGWLARWMAAEGITVANLTPAMGQLLTDGAESAGTSLPLLRLALFVGDALGRRVVEKLWRQAPRVEIVNLYGATESQQALSYHRAVRDTDLPTALPLGRGLPGVDLLVLNEAGEGAGVGELGEIWIRSGELATGYLGDEALTAERFRTNPKTGLASDRLYRTGDLGRYGTDGGVIFAGRADHQVKIRGFRVEVGEIEAALAALPGIREAAVITRGSGHGKRLAAFVVPAGASAPPPRRLAELLTARLPAYMVPATFTTVARLPLNPNGKVDRSALARLPEGSAQGSDPEAAMTFATDDELEQTLSRLLAEVLDLEAVPADTSFFELGGNSLLLVQFQARLQALLGREIQPVEIFNHPTVSALAAHLSASGARPGAPARRADRTAELAAGRERLRRRFTHGRAPAPSSGLAPES